MVKLLLGAGARDIPDKVEHRVTMMCKEECPHEPEEVCVKPILNFFKGKRAIPGVTRTNDTLFSGYGAAVLNQTFCSFFEDKHTCTQKHSLPLDAIKRCGTVHAKSL